MKIALDTKNKVIIFEDSISYDLLNKCLSTLLLSYDVYKNFKISIGNISNSNLIKIKPPLYADWNYKPEYEWLEYNTGKAVISDDKVSVGYSISLKEGKFNIQFDTNE